MYFSRVAKISLSGMFGRSQRSLDGKGTHSRRRSISSISFSNIDDCFFNMHYQLIKSPTWTEQSDDLVEFSLLLNHNLLSQLSIERLGFSLVQSRPMAISQLMVPGL